MRSIRPRLGVGIGGGWTAERGAVAPQPLLTGGDLFDDRVGYRYAMLMRPAFAPGLDPALADRLTALGVVLLADTSAACRDWLDELGAEAVLIRPDRYIHGAARDLADLQDLATSI